MNPLPANHPLELKKWKGQAVIDEIAGQICRISEESFPPEEREPCQTLIKTIQEGKSILYTAGMGNNIRGFTKLTPLGETNSYLMEYLAVEKSSRNLGIGGKLIQFIKQDLYGNPEAGLVLEVEPPEEATGEERDLRLRRIRFYQRQGALLIQDNGAYRMPNLAGEGSLSMRLMWLPVHAGGCPPTHLNLADLFTLIFIESYGETKNNALLSAIINKLPGSTAPIELEQR